MPYKIHISEYACKDLQEPKEIQIGQKHQVNQKAHQGVTRNGRPNYIEIQINKRLRKESKQQMIDSKTHQHMRCEIKRNQINTTNDR